MIGLLENSTLIRGFEILFTNFDKIEIDNLTYMVMFIVMVILEIYRRMTDYTKEINENLKNLNKKL